MNKLTFIDKLQLLKIRAMLKLNQITHKNQLSTYKKSQRFGPLENIARYLGTNKIALQLHKKDETKKEYILELIQLLREYGIDIELIEFEQIFSNDDMRKILEKNPDTEINLRYMIKSYFIGDNVEMKYGITDYCQILDKIEYISEVTKANFRSKDEQIMFIITQLAGYISYNKENKKLSREQLKEISSLKGALLERRTVCIGYSMALERLLTNLGIECETVSGIASREKQENLYWGACNHAWNRVKLNNKWYNVDLTFFKGSGDLNDILVDDKTLEGHYLTGTYNVVSCDESYSRRQELYEKVKNIKNVLIGYDSGKRDMMLQYDIPSNIHDTENDIQRDLENEIKQGEEK